MSDNGQIYETIRASLSKLQQSKQNNAKHTDCDWLFNNLKDDIKACIDKGFTLTAIIKAITSVNVNYSYGGKPLKITGAKLAVWLKANNIARKIHKRKAKKNVKKDVKNVN
jgi:hypothetical protein